MVYAKCELSVEDTLGNKLASQVCICMRAHVVIPFRSMRRISLGITN